MKTFLMIFLALAWLPQETKAIEFNYRENNVVAVLLKDALHSLPLVVRERLKSDRLSVELADLPEERIAELSLLRPLIRINRKVEQFKYDQLKALSSQLWLNGDSSKFLKTKHKTLYQLLLGAILHELFHFYDHKKIPHYEYLKTRKHCIQAAVIRQVSYEPECVAIQRVELSISDSPEFLQLSGFAQRGLWLKENASLNFQEQRSPDVYEYESSEEAFAVNMEFFLLDPEFQCRRPLLYEYFVKQFQHIPFPYSQCEVSKHILIQYSTPTTFADQWQELDFAKLYEIHYLWAGPGEEAFSRFGHSMLRLVFCAPSRTQVGPECLNDIYAHRIVSFRAAIDDMQINSLKGLTGTYPSYLYMLSASDVINEYSRTEFRTLYSLPLKLTQKEKRRVLLAVLEAHWSYRGSYKFLSNNCAHETLNLLQTALVDRPRFLAQSTLRPDSLYHLLIRSGVADKQYAAATLPEQHPHLVFRSQVRLFEDNVKVLKKAGILSHDMGFEDYQSLSASHRLAIAKSFLARNQSSLRKADLYALLNLAELGLERLTLATLKTHMMNFVPYVQKHADQFSLDVSEVTGLLKKMMSANQLIDFGHSYGVPTSTELADLDKAELENRFEKMKSFAVQLLTVFRDYLPESERQRLAEEEQLVNLLQGALPRYK